jgi:hypothetical protein
MRQPIEYELYVKQPVEAVMDQVEIDAQQFGITADELNRAVLNWVIERIQAGPVPEWFLSDLKPE